MKETGVQPAFPVIACHRFRVPLSELFSLMAQNTEISLGIDGRPGGGLAVKKCDTYLLPLQIYLVQVTGQSLERVHFKDCRNGPQQ